MIKKDNIHVLQVVHHMNMGGVEHLVYDMTHAFQKEGIKTSICCLDYLGCLGEGLEKEGIDVFVMDRKPGVNIDLCFKIAHLIKRLKVDIVHTHQYTPYFYGATAAILARRPKIIFSEHGRHQPDKVRPKRVVYNWTVLLPFTDAITADSHFLKRSLQQYEKIPGGFIKVIPNGIKLDKFAHFEDINREEKRRKLGINPDEFALGIVSRLDPVKDHITLLHSFKLVLKQFPKTKLFIAGTGPMFEPLKDLIKKMGLEERAILLGFYEDLLGLLRSLDIFVLSSITESAPLVVLEAMAAGLPVVATNVGGTGEMLLHNQTGMLVPPQKPQAMAKAILELLKDPQRAKAMGKKGQGRVYKYYSFKGMIENYKRLYYNTLAHL